MRATRSSLTVRYLRLVCLVGAFMAISSQAGAAEFQLFLVASDLKGQPVGDLRAEEVIVTVAGTACAVTGLQSGTEPMKVALLVDNSEASGNALLALRDGLESFLDVLPAKHEVGLFTIAGQVRRLEDFTTDREALVKRALAIFAQRGSSTVLRDGLVETWKRRFKDDDVWPVFVVVTTDGSEGSTVRDKPFNEFVGQLRARSATVHTVMFSSRNGGVQTNVALFLKENTGGSFETIAASTALPGVLSKLATTMGAQHEAAKDRYRVVFECDNDTPTQIRAGVSRQDISVQLFGSRQPAP
jgi:hypothetical protein